MSECMRCPRNCKVKREEGEIGICGVTGKEIWIARVALHYWEEPCISGEHGSGTVFFCGCSLHCVYCQNYEIAHIQKKPELFLENFSVSIDRLAEIFLELQEKKATNINLVTPTHYGLEIAEAIKKAKKNGLIIPIVYNCSGYENVEILKQLEGLIDIYLTDFKYIEEEMAIRYSKAKDYPNVVKKAIKEMVRQQMEPIFDEKGVMKRGVIVRHLLLPNHVRNGKAIIKYLYETYGNTIYISLMNQYTPLTQVKDFPEINRKVTKREYNRFIDYALSLGVENGFIQEGETAKESFIPSFYEESIK